MAPTKKELIKARAIKRKERADARRVLAEEHKATGDVHFRNRAYRKAIAEWEVAIKINGPTAILLSNMAQAWLNLKAYDAAEECASRALRLDPQLLKARYRRGIARKMNLKLATAKMDFLIVLTQRHDLAEANKALNETNALLRERDEDDSVIQSEVGPSLSSAKFELESESESSDWEHDGNGVPCKPYNRDGCTRGVECGLSHAPDKMSVRDRLGRNVCVRLLLGHCSLGSSACPYSHDKSYLPSGRWWDSADKIDTIWGIIGEVLGEIPDPPLFAAIDHRFAWKPARGARVEDACVWNDYVMMLEGFSDVTDDPVYAAWVSKGKDGRGRGRGPGSGYGHPEWEEGFTDFDNVCQCHRHDFDDDNDDFAVNSSLFIDAYSL